MDNDETQQLENSRQTTSLRESREAINQVVATAQKIICIFDRNLSDPGYSDPDRISLLESFLLSSRKNRVQIAVHEAGHLDRDCARLMALFRRHPDTFAIHRTVDSARYATDALVIADGHSYWHQLHQDHRQVVFALGDVSGTAPLMKRFNEIWESSEPAIGATVLGL